MTERVFRQFCALVVWAVIISVPLAFANAGLLYANYLSIKGAFELSNYEKFPLWMDELLGWTFGAFASKATLAHLYAFFIAVFVAAGFFFCAYLLFRLRDLAHDRRLYRRAGDDASAEEASRQLVDTGLVLVAVLACLPVVVYWDVDLFRFRSVANALGLENPEEVAPVLLNWEHVWQENGDLYAVNLARLGGIAYPALTALASMLLEYAFRRTRDAWRLLVGAVEDAWSAQGDQAETGTGVSSFVEEVHTAAGEHPAAQPAAQASTAADVPGVGVPSMAVASGEIMETPSVTPSDAQVASTEPVATPFIDPLEAAPPVQHEQPTPRPPVRAGAQAPRHDVIGSVPASRMTLEDALADPSLYHVDRAQGRVTIWDRAYWTVLRNHHAPDPVSEKEEAPV